MTHRTNIDDNITPAQWPTIPPEEGTLREAIVKLLAHKSGKRIPKNLLPPRGGYLTASPYLTEDQIEQLVQLIQERERLARMDELGKFGYASFKYVIPEDGIRYIDVDPYIINRIKELKGKL